MDHSVYGYLCRRSQEELERIITMYWHLKDDAHYGSIIKMAEEILEKRRAENEPS